MRVLFPGTLSIGEAAASRVAPPVQAGSTTAGVGRAVNLHEVFPDPCNHPLLTQSPCHGQSLLSSFIASLVPVALDVWTLPGGVPCSGHLAGRGNLPLVGGSLPRAQHKGGLGWGQNVALNPNVRLGWDSRQGRLTRKGVQGPPAAPHHLPVGWCTAFPTISVLGDAICGAAGMQQEDVLVIEPAIQPA